MDHDHGSAMPDALRLTRAGRLGEAFDLLQRALGGPRSADVRRSAAERLSAGAAARRGSVGPARLLDGLPPPHRAGPGRVRPRRPPHLAARSAT